MRDLPGAAGASTEVKRAKNKVAAERATSPLDLMPEEDFSRAGMARSDAATVQQAAAEAAAASRGYQEYAGGSAGQSRAEALGLNPAASPELSSGVEYKSQAQRAVAVVQQVMKSQQGAGDLTNYPSLAKAVVNAATNGVDINEQDVARLINYAAVDRAANMYVNAPDDTRRRNILLTADPVTRAAILDVAASKASDALDALNNADSNWFVGALGKTVGAALLPFSWANENAQHAFRAGMQGLDSGNALENASQMVTTAGLFNPQFYRGIATNWNATERGQFDQKYLDTLKASGQYSPKSVDVLTAIAKAQADGDPDPITTVLGQYGNDPEADLVIRQLIYKPDADPKLQELARQIDSANRGSTGQLYTTLVTTPDSGEFSEFRGTVPREQVSNAASIWYSFYLDPTIAGSKLLGAYRVARYALSKIAPGENVYKALASKKIAGVETNAARRYVNQFTASLQKLDDIAAKGDTARTAAYRQVMARHFKEFPEDAIEEFRKQGIRTTDDFIQFVDETNDAYLLTRGEPAGFARVTAAEKSPFAEDPLYERMFARGDTQVRNALLPRMNPVRDVRQRAVKGINRAFAPSARGRAVVDEFYGGGTTDEIAQALDTKSAQIGKFDQDAAGPGFIGRRADGVTRLFSSLPNKQQIYTADARDAGTFYKFARSFLTKRHADVLTDAFRDAEPGQRRLMVAGVIRTAAGARGVNLAKEDVLNQIDDLATGSRVGELYSAGKITETVPNHPLPLSPEQQAENAIVTRPSNIDGHEHALHLWQTTEAVHIPSIREMESLKAYRAITPDWLENAPQRVTDAWSLGTLYGLRFALRSSIEDLWSYTVTGGRMGALYQGRRASTAIRDARPNLTIKRYKTGFGWHKKGDPILKDGHAQIVVKSRLGMFGKRGRAIGDAADNGTGLLSQTLGAFFLDNFDESRIIAAQVAAKEGDWAPLRGIISEAMARQKFTTLSPKAIEDFQDLANTAFGLKQMDELAETSRYINQGSYPAIGQGTETPGVADAILPADPQTVFGKHIDLRNGDPNFGLFWFRNVQGVVDNDGIIGKLAVANLDNRQKAINVVADALRKDTTFGYKERFSALYTGATDVDEFARRYVDDVTTMFSGPDGKLNQRLLDKLAPKNPDGTRTVSLYDVADDGEKTLRVSPNSILGYRKDGAPDYVLGRETVPMPTNETALFDRAWGWMGEQYARLAREPIFLANYHEQRELLRSYEATLAEHIGPDAARAHTARMASDRAYGYTLAYVDNPENRSQLAWKIRNVSRYYRATEDFYRRMFRIAKNNPEGFWKTALTYQVLDDTGFVFTDDNGDKYFSYPGTQFLQDAVKTVGVPFLGTNTMNIDPFFMGGKVKMLAPSSDPEQFFPQVMGPMMVWPTQYIFSKFPEMQGLERYLIGDYAVGQSWYQALIPQALSRAMNGLNDDERQSMYGSAVMDAFAIAAANGMIPEKDSAGNPIETIDQLKQTDAYGAITRIAWGGVITRMLMGYGVPASPQQYVDNVTDYARAHGITSMRGAFLDLINQQSKKGSVNPVGDAYAEWWKLNPKGDLMPFTVSKTQNADTINAIADVQAVKGLQQWWTDNQGLYKKYPNAALFLAPRKGDFSWQSWSLMTNVLGLREPKGFEDFFTDVLSSKANAMYYDMVDHYKAQIAALDPVANKDQITALKAQQTADTKWIADQYPLWSISRAEDYNWTALDKHAQVVFDQAKTMVDDLKAKGEDTPASRAIRSAIYTYIDGMTAIKSITGSTNAEDAQKREWKAKLDALLTNIGEGDPNAAVFIKNVINRTPDFEKEVG